VLEGWVWRYATRRCRRVSWRPSRKAHLSPTDTFDSKIQLVLDESGGSTDAPRIGIGYFVLPETAADKPGFAFLPSASVELEETVPIADGLTLGLGGTVDLTGAVGVFVSPEQTRGSFCGFGCVAHHCVRDRSWVPTSGWRRDASGILGTPDGSRLEATGCQSRQALAVSVPGATRCSANFWPTGHGSS